MVGSFPWVGICGSPRQVPETMTRFRHMDGRWEAAPLDGPRGTSDQGLPALQLAAAPRTDGR